jgi:hypothetical protein
MGGKTPATQAGVLIGKIVPQHCQFGKTRSALQGRHITKLLTPANGRNSGLPVTLLSRWGAILASIKMLSSKKPIKLLLRYFKLY